MNNGKSQTKPLLAIIGVNFIWGFDFIAIEYMMEYMSPAVFTLARLAIGSIILTACVLIVRKVQAKNLGGMKDEEGGFLTNGDKDAVNGLCANDDAGKEQGFCKKTVGVIRREDMPRVFISGGIGMAFYFTIENLGTGMTSASFSALIMATVPVFGMIGDRLFFGNKITPLKIICIVASIVGVYLLVSGEPMGASVIGTIAMFVAAILWTFYIVYVKPLYEKYDLLTLLTGLFVSGLIVQIPIALISQGITHAPIEFTPVGIVITLATAVVCIIIGEFGYIYAVGGLSTTLVSAFENVLPLTTVIFSLFIFGTMLTGSQIVGGIIIMAAVTAIAFIESRQAGESPLA